MAWRMSHWHGHGMGTARVLLRRRMGIPVYASEEHCPCCHAVSDATRMNAMASTPSFAVLRAMADWDRRFQTFYILNPHPAFTQIQDVTEPFPIDRPSPIAPMEITIDDLQAILAYVAGVPPAERAHCVQDRVEMAEARDRDTEHRHQLALLLAQVLRKHRAEVRSALEQAAVEQVGSRRGDRRDLGKARLH